MLKNKDKNKGNWFPEGGTGSTRARPPVDTEPGSLTPRPVPCPSHRPRCGLLQCCISPASCQPLPDGQLSHAARPQPVANTDSPGWLWRKSAYEIVRRDVAPATVRPQRCLSSARDRDRRRPSPAGCRSWLTEHAPGTPWSCLLFTAELGGRMVGGDSSDFVGQWTWSFPLIFKPLAKSRPLLYLAGDTEIDFQPPEL